MRKIIVLENISLDGVIQALVRGELCQNSYVTGLQDVSRGKVPSPRLFLDTAPAVHS